MDGVSSRVMFLPRRTPEASSPTIRSIRRAGSVLAAAALLPAAFAEETWIGSGPGNWSDSTKWLDGTAPALGGDETLTVHFARSDASFSANLDLGVFTLGHLDLNTLQLLGMQITSASGSALRFVGPAPVITAGALSLTNISLPLVLAGAPLRIDGRALGIDGSVLGLTLSGVISEEGAPRSVSIEMDALRPDLGLVELSGANTFTGGVELKSGNLSVGSSGGLGSSALTVRGGSLRLNTSSLSNAAVLHSNLLLADSVASTWSGVISSAVPNTGLLVRGRNALTLTAASTYNGATTLDFSLNPVNSIFAGPTLTLTGNGSLLQSSAFNVRAGSQLTIEAAAAGATDRIGNGAPISLRSGKLRFADPTGNAAVKTETVGSVTVAGQSTISVASSASAPLALTAADLQRVERGTLVITGINSGTGNARLFVNAAPALVGGGASSGTAISIIPWAIGGRAIPGISLEGAPSSFVTYGAVGGFRLLDTALEYALSLTAGATHNVRLASPTTLPASATINSLWLVGRPTVNGAGRTLTIGSGALASSDGSTILPNLNFGAAEAQITTIASTLALSGTVTGSNGLTKSGPGTLWLQAANSFSGPLTINAGSIRFSAQNQLGADAGAIAIHGNGTSTGLSYGGLGPLTLTRPLSLNTGLGSISFAVPEAGELTLAGGTSGSGGLRLVSSATNRIRLTGVANHTGPTVVGGGPVWFDSAGALGSGDLATTAEAALELGGNWSSSGRIHFGAPTSLKTNGFNVLWSGLLTGGSRITKTSAGNVRIASGSGFYSPVDFDTGRLEVGEAGVITGSSEIVLTGGAALVLDNAVIASNDRYVTSGAVVLKNGELRLEGHATTPVTETVRFVTASNDGALGNATITVTAPGTAGTTLQIGTLSLTAPNTSYAAAVPPVLIRGSQLGGTAGGAFTRVVIPGTAPGFRGEALVGGFTGSATSFGIYDDTVDAAGPIGYRALKATEYSNATNIRNPANGGTTPTDAHLLLSGAGTATGASNTAQSLTLDAGSELTWSQLLGLSRGAVFVRGGATPAKLSGPGMLDGLGLPVSFYLAGDLVLDAKVTTSAEQFSKLGSGTLILGSGADLPGTVMAQSGTIRSMGGTALADSLVSIAPQATFEMVNSASVGSLAGAGSLKLNNGTLTAGLLPVDFTFGGIVSGPGTLRIVDGGRPEAHRTLDATNTHSGGVTLDSGVLVLGNSQSLGGGPFTANGGAIASLSEAFTLANPLILNGTLDVRTNLTIPNGAAVTGAGKLQIRTGHLVVEGLVDYAGSAEVSHFATFTGESPYFALTVSGSAGSLRPQAGILVGADGVLYLDEETAPYTGVAGGRLRDNAPLELRSGWFYMNNREGSNPTVSETIGDLRIDGFSTITQAANPLGSTTLNAARLTRLNRGTFEILPARTLGAAGAGAGFVKFTTPPVTADGGVVPYATATLDGSLDEYGVVVHDAANGLRLLTSGEYTTSIAAATPASHLLVPASGNLVNTGTLTVRSLTLGATDTTLVGGGTINVTSGLVLYTGSGENVDNMINFGTNEGFIAVPDSTFPSAKFLKPITGSGGLTIFGRGVVSLNGGNQVTGPLVLNGSTRLLLTSGAQLGPETSPIQINGVDTGAGFQTDGASLTISRPIVVNTGYLAVSAVGPDDELTLSGAVSGSGGIFAGIRPGRPAYGFTILAGANSYSGPTVVEGNLAFASDAALGNSSALIMAGGSIKLLGDWTTSRRFEGSGLSNHALTLDSNGFNATISGVLAGRSFFDKPALIKTGAGTLTIPVPQDEYTGPVTVSGGRLVLNAAGRLSSASAVSLEPGGTFVIDNRAQVAPRGTISFGASGGELIVHGHATQPTTLQGNFSVSSGFSTLTLDSQGAPVTLDYSALAVTPGANLLVRGDQLGGPTGGYTRARFSTAPTMTNGILRGVFASASTNAAVESFATYDTTSDDAGVIGIRPLRSNEFVSGGEIRNPANGGATPTSANFLASGTMAAVGPSNTLNTLTMEPGAELNLGAGQMLSLSENAIVVRGGAPATIRGGILQGADQFWIREPRPVTLGIFGAGELRFGAMVAAGSQLRIYGPGGVTVTAPLGEVMFNVAGGTLRAAAGDPLSKSTVQLEASGRLELNGVSTVLGALNGSGTVDLGGGTLSLGTTAPSTFSGALTGSGNFEKHGHTSAWLSGVSSFTGSFTVRSTLKLTGTALGISSVSIQGGQLNLQHPDDSGSPRLPKVPLSMNTGSLFVEAARKADTTSSFGTLTGEGSNRLFVGVSSDEPRIARLTFAALQRQNRGVFEFTTSATGAQSAIRLEFETDLSSSLVGNSAVPTQRPVLPFAIVNGHPATFEPTVGLRALLPTEQTTTFSSGDNVKLSSAQSFDGEMTINSLELANVGLFGTGKLHVTSGLVTAYGTINSALDFGTAEGVLFSTNNQATYAGTLSGSNGVTVTGATRFSGNNTFTGPLRVIGGSLTFESAANLGADPSPVVLHGSNLFVGGSGSLILPRGIDLRGGGEIGRAFGSTRHLDLAGAITGAGSLRLSGDLTLSNPGNSYSGETIINGNVSFASDAVFGQSALLKLQFGGAFSGSPVLRPLGDWTTTRTVQVLSPGTLDTGAATTTLNGPLLGGDPLTKAGSGRLIINDGTQFIGPLVVSAGALRISGTLGSGGVTVAAGARLEGNASFGRRVTVSGTLAPGASAGLLEMGDLTFEANSTLEMELISPAEFDQLRVNGTVLFNGLTQLALTLGAESFGQSVSFPLLLNDGADAIAITPTRGFAIGGNALAENELFTVGAQTFRITYAGGDGNDVLLTVPEPSTAGLVIAGLLAMTTRRRRAAGR